MVSVALILEMKPKYLFFSVTLQPPFPYLNICKWDELNFYFFQVHKAVGFGADDQMPKELILVRMLPLI
jgi:hypothetical protein